MLMIRFQRIGRKNDPAFRIVVLEKTSGPKAGNYVDLVGTYNPKTKAVTLKPDLVRGWIAKGAQVSPSLHNLLVKEGVLEGKKFAVVSKKNLEKNKPAEEAPAAEAAAPAEALAEEAAPAEDAAPEEVTVEAPAEMEAAVETEAEPAPEEAPGEEAPAEEAAAEAPAEEEPKAA